MAGAVHRRIGYGSGVNLPIRGGLVILRDLVLDDADRLDAWAADPAVRGEFNDFGLPPRPVDREALAKGPFRNERNGELMIERAIDGSPVGLISWHMERYGPNVESGAWNIGISLVPDARGHGFGAEAQRLAADYLFATTDVDRVEASTDIENKAEQRSLEKAGFIREAILRGAQFRAGGRHDLVNYARLRTDP
jgi:RimJ/RimL family protein N-acetyltransferase